jgi:hypothetical protein
MFRKAISFAQERMLVYLFEQKIHAVEKFRVKEFHSKGCSPGILHSEAALGRY